MKPEKPIKLFGTDGIRGEAGKFPLDSTTVRAIGASLTRHLAKRTGGRPPFIVVGRDTRESGPEIERDLIAGARSENCQIESAGIITTPGVAFLAHTLPADAGVVISASHNPYQDNGIKVFDPSGRKLDDVTERHIESDIVAGRFVAVRDADEFALREQRSAELREQYLGYLQREVANQLCLNGMKLVVDCANGAAFDLAPKLFARLGGQVVAINNEPDGRNINLDCGSLHVENLQSRVTAEKADLGIAFDGDADRALFVDAGGQFVDGDATLWVLANYFQSRGDLDHRLVVATVMTNLGLEVALRSRGITLVRTDVGDKYVLDELLRTGAALGGEQSGHIIFPKMSLAGDGLITTINLLRAVCSAGKSLAELTQGFTRFPQKLVNVRVRRKIPFEELPTVQRAVNEIEKLLSNRGRLLLRYSGTEPLARVMIESERQNEVDSSAARLAAVIRSEIGTE